MNQSQLIPPDLDHCQRMKSRTNFMTLGGKIPGLHPCGEIPFWVAVENAPNPKDGLTGSMSLCNECAKYMRKVMPENYATLITVADYQEARLAAK